MQIEPVLECENLTVGYRDKAVLSGVNLSLEPGHFVCLLGPNGAGKTTLLRTLSHHLPAISGKIRILSRPLEGLNAPELARMMAVVLTDRVTPPLLTAFEFVALGRYPHTDFLGRLTVEDRKAVEQALEAVHAADLAGRQFANLSDGERQKILVARALAQQPRILLLDEPTVHLDLKHRVEVMTILAGLCRNQGITVVASLHDVDVAAKVSDRVALIKNGRIRAWGQPETVLTGQAVARLYDFAGADFNRHLGSIELRGDGRRGRAFVVAGLASGAWIYRLLAKQGFAMATGVVHTNDLDYYVASSLGAACISQPPMDKINGTALEQGCRQIKTCNFVIDSGFAVSDWNRGNLELLRAALDSGKKVFSLRSTSLDEIAVKNPEQWIACRDADGLLEALGRLIPATCSANQPGTSAKKRAAD